MIALVLILQAAVTPGTPWIVADRTSAGGVKSISATTTAEDKLSRMVVKCDIAQESIVSIQFLQPRELGQSADKTVTMRFDNGPGVPFDWEFPGPGAFVRTPYAVTTLTVMMTRAKSVQIETTNGMNFAVQASFPVAGADAPIRRVLAACGYKFGVSPAPPPPPPVADPAADGDPK
jgi:hypothetical protein